MDLVGYIFVSYTEVVMTDKELKKLSRVELLELLLTQTKKVEELEAKLQKKEEEFQNQKEALEKKIESREILIEKAGSIAEASLILNGIFEAAQKAADQYLENIKLMEDKMLESCKDTIDSEE